MITRGEGGVSLGCIGGVFDLPPSLGGWYWRLVTYNITYNVTHNITYNVTHNITYNVTYNVTHNITYW